MPIPADSRIVAVTVFLDRAKITRTAQVRLPAGQSTVLIPDLPTTIYPDSVRAKGRAAGARILGLDVPTEFHNQTPDAEAAQLQNQLDALELQQRELADQTAVEAERVKMSAALRATGAAELVKGLAWGRTTIDSIDTLSKYAATEDASAKAQIRSIADLQKNLARQIDALRARLRQIQQPAQTTRRAIHVSVEADEAETLFDMEVTYVCGGATWTPLYDARLQGDKIQLTYLAMLTQGTGENWADVDLSLSTARSAVTTEVPELAPWFLDVFVPAPPPPPMMPAPMARSMRTFASKAADVTGQFEVASEAAPEVEIIQAIPDKQGASVTFRIPRKTSIPSDHTPHRTQIAELELPATLDYITAPCQAEQAYLRAKVENKSGFVLLPGQANLFHGDEYVGVTQIEDTAAKEFELQMGVDERVSVTRELVNREVSKAFIGSTRKTQYAYRIRISNQLERASRITVLDRLPHSRHEEIKVKLLDATPKVTEQTDLSGLQWRIMLEPGQSQEIHFGFSVEFSKMLSVVGLQD